MELKENTFENDRKKSRTITILSFSQIFCKQMKVSFQMFLSMRNTIKKHTSDF